MEDEFIDPFLTSRDGGGRDVYLAFSNLSLFCERMRSCMLALGMYSCTYHH